MSKLVAMVPGTRRACGRLALFAKDGRVLFGPVRLLATSNKRIALKKENPTRDPRLPFGNPPAGSYLVVGTLPPGFVNQRRPRRFGTTGALILRPEKGACMAAFASGRRLFYLHGGPTDDEGRLRPTLGGLRVSDRDMSALLDAVNRAFSAGDPVSTFDLVDVSGATPGPADRVGKGRPFLQGATKPAPRIGVAHAALLLGGGGLLVPRNGQAPPKNPGRRRFLASALLLLGSLGADGCCSGSDEASPCDAPTPCDPVDSWCPPQGYVCSDQVAGGADLGGGGDTSDTSGGSG